MHDVEITTSAGDPAEGMLLDQHLQQLLTRRKDIG
jgi:hypothetical protein